MNIKKQLNKLKQKALSNKEIVQATGAKFIAYPELSQFNNINDVFGSNDSIALLYLQNHNYGHWVCLNRNGENIEFFDPYGILIDKQLKYNSKHKNNELNQNYFYLTRLLYNSEYKISYNEFSFQSKGSNINTCGRHIICRILYKNIDLYKYKKLIDKIQKEIGFNPDDIVTIITQNI